MELQKIDVAMELMCETDQEIYDKESRRVIETVVEIIDKVGNVKDVMNRAVDIAVSLHDEAEERGAECALSSRHELLYVTGFLCSYLGLKEKTPVEKLLRCIHDCEGGFKRLFWGALLGQDFIMGSNPLHQTAYFLDMCGELEFIVEGKKTRMVEVPLELGHTAAEVAAALGRPAPLLLFLKYGADPRLIVDSLSIAVAGSEALAYRVRPSLKTLLRTLPCLPPALEVLLPSEGRPRHPPSLRHIARCFIRRHLLNHPNPPEAVRELPVPEFLKSYLNLECD